METMAGTQPSGQALTLCVLAMVGGCTCSCHPDRALPEGLGYSLPACRGAGVYIGGSGSPAPPGWVGVAGLSGEGGEPFPGHPWFPCPSWPWGLSLIYMEHLL